jgi:flavin reductase (DIM6/NTAB) family NADH-FMN oxidoreductase RutF
MYMANADEVGRALGSLGRGLFLMTASYQNKRSGAVVRWVQPCADEPPLLCVALRTGHSINTLIRDSRSFALCAIEDDRVLMRKFEARAPDVPGDPFDWLETERMATGAPVLKRSTPVFDCAVLRHFDLEADHSLYVGQVVAARCNGVVGTAGAQA